jgi:hypothetical protein
MSKIIIDSKTQQVLGIDIPITLPNEQFEIEADVSGLKKTLNEDAYLQKLNELNEPLYVLLLPDLEVHTAETKTVESTTESASPVMIDVVNYIPLLDANNNQLTYQPTTLGKTTEVTEEPVMITVYDEEGNESIIQESDESENLLYWGQVPVGSPLPLQTSEVVQQQKVDDAGELLYWNEVTEDVVTYQPQEPLLITNEDENWTEDLEFAYDIIPSGTVVDFSIHPTLFTYQEIINYPTLEEVKQAKLEELRTRRDSELVSGFQTSATGTEMTMGYDPVDQRNYRGLSNMISIDPTFDNIQFKTLSHGMVSFLRDQFIQVLKDAYAHEATIQYNYLYLEAQIANANTRAEVAAIVW